MKPISLLLLASALFLVACSAPEDPLWEKRVSDASKLTGDSTYLAAIDLDVQAVNDSIGDDSLENIALRDLGIYLFDRPQSLVLDTQDFVEDSVLPRIRMDRIQHSLLQRLQNQPFNVQLSARGTEEWRNDQSRFLKALQAKSKATFAEPTLVDSLLEVALNASDTSIAKIPVAALLLRDRKNYVWVIVTKWGEKTDPIADSITHRYEHIEGTLFDAHSGLELGKFFCE